MNNIKTEASLLSHDNTDNDDVVDDAAVDDAVDDDAVDDDVDEGYESWTEGNWCYLLPDSTCNNDSNDQRRQDQQNGIINTCTNNRSVNKSEERGDTYNDTVSNISGIRRRSSNTDTDDYENKIPSSSPKKKMRLLQPPPAPPPPSDTSRNNHTTVNRKDHICCDEEVNNSKITNHTNDDVADDGDGDGDGDGYESWTEGNWCLLLPPTSTSTSTSTGTIICTGTCARTPTVKTNTERRKQPIHSLRPDASDNECDTDYLQNDNDDDDDDDDDEKDKDKDNDEKDKDNDNDNDESNKSRKGNNNITPTTTQNDINWNEMFQRLVTYKKQHKSTTVPKGYAVDPELGIWASNQRKLYSNKAISDHRVDLLNSIGFVWSQYDNAWHEMFQRLVTYKKQHHGSMLVPSKYEADTQLGTWVQHQRYYYNNNNKILSADRIERLESIGFVWRIVATYHDAKWMKNYNRLVVYKEKYKSTQVPVRYNGDNQLPHLGNWVSLQQGAYTKGKLLKSRVERLNLINFIWRAERTSKSGRDDDGLAGNQNHQKQSKKSAVIAPTLLQKQQQPQLYQPQQNIVSYQQHQQQDILCNQQHQQNMLSYQQQQTVLAHHQHLQQHQLLLSYQQEQQNMLSYQQEQQNMLSYQHSNSNVYRKLRTIRLCRS